MLILSWNALRAWLLSVLMVMRALLRGREGVADLEFSSLAEINQEACCIG